MSSEFSKRSLARVSIASSQVKTYTLNNARQYFIDSLKFRTTKEWVENTIDNGDEIYMIVGFHTVQDAKIMQGITQDENASAKAKVPFSLLLSTAGAIIPFGNLIDPAADASFSSTSGMATRFLAPGEQVCALQYRKIRYRWFSSRKADTLSLGKNPYWTVQDTWRGTSESAEDVKDFLELEDLDIEVAAEEWGESYNVGNEIILVPKATP